MKQTKDELIKKLEERIKELEFYRVKDKTHQDVEVLRAELRGYSQAMKEVITSLVTRL